jgi:MFS family permease
VSALPWESRNYRAFFWHALFLSITITFTEVNSVIPAMILHVGGSEIHVGVVSAIMIGVPMLAKLNFAGFLHSKGRKKPFLLTGIHVRILSLALIAVTLWQIELLETWQLLLIIYIELLLFTIGGAFAGISYIDLIGKSFSADTRKRFFTRKQFISSIGILVSAFIARQLLNTFDFPLSYLTLFAAAAFVLLIASGGFWFIKEKPAENNERKSYLETLKMIPQILRSDSTIRNYLWFVNIIGFHVALTPFYVAFAKQQYYLDPGLAGNLLFIQIVGMVISSLLWPRFVRRGGFKRILKVWTVLCGVLPMLALLTGFFLPLPFYLALFILTGSTISARMVTQDAVIVELSDEKTRVLYTAIIGTLNLTIVIFPIILGSLIKLTGYLPVFVGVGIVSFTGFLFLDKMICPVDVEIKPDLTKQ